MCKTQKKKTFHFITLSQEQLKVQYIFEERRRSSSPSCTPAVLPLDLRNTYKQLWAEKQAHKDLLFWRPDTLVALLILVPLQCCCSIVSKNGYSVNRVGAELDQQRRYRESLLMFPFFRLISSLTLNLVHNIFYNLYKN